jgi:hypothetical protein
MVIDHNPDIIERLRGEGVANAYGDSSDLKFVQE